MPNMPNIDAMSKANQLAMMKAQLADMQKNPKRYEQLIAGGYVCAGFGGDLNGVDIPNTFISGKLPAGTTPEEALKGVMEIMRQTIAEAEQKKLK